MLQERLGAGVDYGTREGLHPALRARSYSGLLMTHSPRIWLLDIHGEIAGIRELTKNATEAEFAKSWAMKRAVEHALLIVSEAA